MMLFKKGKLQKLIIDSHISLVIFYILFLILTILIDGYLYPDKNLKGLYFTNIVLAGIVFWRSLTVQILSAALFTGLFYYFAPFNPPQMINIIIQGLTQLLAIFSVSTAIKFYIREKENTLNLTLTLAKTLDARDKYSALHSENVANYALLIAQKMGLSKKLCEQIHMGGLLHDIGKIGVQESILIKPTKLTIEEFNNIKLHPTIGFEMVKHIPYFRKSGVLDAILYHHERFDGKGYPMGLKGKQIPLVARILAVADSFDAMTSRRYYRDEMDLDCVVKEIRNNKGTQFDPEITDVFLQILKSGILSTPKLK